MTPADNFVRDVMARFGDFVGPGIQWQRALWDVGRSRPTDRGKTKEGVASALTCKSERRSYTHGQHIPG